MGGPCVASWQSAGIYLTADSIVDRALSAQKAPREHVRIDILSPPTCTRLQFRFLAITPHPVVPQHGTRTGVMPCLKSSHMAL